MSISGKVLFKNANLKVYLLFLLFTAILAVIMKLAKIYTATTMVSMTIVGAPQSLVFSNEGKGEIEVDYEASGFALVQNSFRKMTLEVPFKELSVNKGTYEWGHDLDRAKVINILNAGSEKIFVRPERLRFTVDILSERMIPVLVNQSFEYNAGYGSDGLLVIDPPMIRIIGAAEKIGQIDTIFTIPVVRDKLSDNISTEIALDVARLPEGISLVPEVVVIEQKVTKYTEGTLDIPIEIVNSDATVQLFPKKIKVFYQVPVKDFDRIRAMDFTIVCDFSSKNVTDQFMTLELTKKPNAVSDVRLGTKQVQYVIVQ
ncbi:MAG: hypothetical protein ACI828_000819 [Flavobacteriales bacterium]|jgi:hypothetical protein